MLDSQSFSDRNHTWPFQLNPGIKMEESIKFQWSKSYMAIPTAMSYFADYILVFQWSKSYMAIPTLRFAPAIATCCFSDRNHTWPFQPSDALINELNKVSVIEIIHGHSNKHPRRVCINIYGFSDRNHTWPFQPKCQKQRSLFKGFSDRNHTWPFQPRNS